MKNCNACGKCCTKYGGGGLSATQEEIENWREFYPHIYQWVSNDEIWIDPNTHKVAETCPFLYQDPTGRRQLCRIYEQRPEDCRLYPSSVAEMIRDDCEMIEPKDLRNSKQAEKELAVLMADSRLS